MPAIPRIELLIDVFDQHAQPAQVLASLTADQLILAILDEFRDDLPYLGAQIERYELRRASDHIPLDRARPLGRQLAPSTHLMLAELLAPPPKQGQSVAAGAYVQEQSTDAVFPIDWQPAIIGRPRNAPDDALLLVDCTPLTGGLRVSRRHAQITEADDQFFIASERSNPTSLISANGVTQLGATPHPLQHGDIIRLDASGIQLTFLRRAD